MMQRFMQRRAAAMPAASRLYHDFGYHPRNTMQSYSKLRGPTPVSPAEAVKVINSNDNVFIQTGASAPQSLLKAMAARHSELRNVNVFQLATEGEAPYTQYPESFNVHAFFVGANVRANVQAGKADFIPCFLCEVPRFIRENRWPITVALVNCSVPDKHGYVSLGPAVDISLSAVENATIVIAQINKAVPRTHGTSNIHISQIQYVCEVNEPLMKGHISPPSDIEDAIGGHVAALIEDESCLQMGIGGIPNAVLSKLTDRKNLGIHTEMFSDGLIDLIECGAVTNTHKKVSPGISIAGFAIGTQRLYDFIDDNPVMHFRDIEWVNDTSVIRQNPKAISINSAIEVDITGQVNSDSIGSRIFSGVGGQVDFVRGSVQSQGGKSIIALPSQTKKGRSRLSAALPRGAGVVTTRAHLNYLATEYGAVNCWGRTLRDRAARIISIAHPDHRESLEKEFFELYNVMPRMEN